MTRNSCPVANINWEIKLSVSWFDCDKSLTCRCLNSNSGHFGCFTFIIVSCGESCLLISWYAVDRYNMMGSDDNRVRSRIPSAEGRGWSHRSGTAPCTRRWGSQVSWLSLKTKVDGLSLVWPQNHWDGLASKPLWRFISGLASKLLGLFLPVWPQNRWWRVSRFGPQNRQLRFGELCLKITAMVSWFVS
jgi:hypothetical protein